MLLDYVIIDKFYFRRKLLRNGEVSSRAGQKLEFQSRIFSVINDTNIYYMI